jgi:hypothetical protein
VWQEVVPGKRSLWSLIGLAMLVPVGTLAVSVAVGLLTFGGEGPSLAKLIDSGASSWEVTTNGRWWRLVTSGFLVSGVFETAAPLFVVLSWKALSQFGRRMFVVILLGGLLAGSVSALWVSREGLSMGGMGMVMGLLGAVIGWKLRHRRDEPRKMLLSIGMWLLVTALLTEAPMRGDLVSSMSPMASGLVGLLLGVCLAPPLEERKSRVWLAWAPVVGLVVIGAATWGATVTLPRSDIDINARHQFMSAQIRAGDEVLRIWRFKENSREMAQRGTFSWARASGEVREFALPAVDAALAKVVALPLTPSDVKYCQQQVDLRVLQQKVRQHLEELAAVMEQIGAEVEVAPGAEARGDPKTDKGAEGLVWLKALKEESAQLQKRMEQLRDGPDPFAPRRGSR